MMTIDWNESEKATILDAVTNKAFASAQGCGGWVSGLVPVVIEAFCTVMAERFPAVDGEDPHHATKFAAAGYNAARHDFTLGTSE